MEDARKQAWDLLVNNSSNHRQKYWGVAFGTQMLPGISIGYAEIGHRGLAQHREQRRVRCSREKDSIPNKLESINCFVSGIPVKPVLQNGVLKLWLCRVAHRFVQEWPHGGYYTTRWTKWSRPDALSQEQLGSCADVCEANMEVDRQTAWTCTNKWYKVKRSYTQACEQFIPTPEQNNSRESCRISVRLYLWKTKNSFGQWRSSPHDE